MSGRAVTKNRILARGIIHAALLAICLALLLGSLRSLEGFDVTLVTFGSLPTWDDRETVQDAVGAKTEAALFTRTEGAYISDAWERGAAVSVYTCGELFFELAGLERVHGRFLWDSDSGQRTKFAVISESLAVRMFAGKDCIGEIITLGRAEYHIVGVCRETAGPLASVDEYAVYLPIDSFSAAHTQGGCLLRSEDSLSLRFAIRRGISAAGGVRYTDDISTRAAMWVLPGRLALLALWLVALVYAVKLAVRYFGLKIVRTKFELESMYIWQYLRSHWLGVLLHALGAAGLAVLLWLWLRAASFEVVIDPELIPGSLIDLQAWAQKIAAYVRNGNAAQNIPLALSKQAGLIGAASVVLAVASAALGGSGIAKCAAFLSEKIDR